MKRFLPVVILLASSFTCVGQSPLLQFTHKGSVLHVRFSPDGAKLLSYSSGNQDLGLWNIKEKRLLWKRPISFIQKADEHYTLTAFAWSPDQRTIATGSANGTVQLWDAQTGTFLWIADISKSDVAALAFSPDGKLIAAVPFSGKLLAAKILKVATGAPVISFGASPCTQIAASFDLTGNELKIGNQDGNVGIWKVASGRSMEGHRPECKKMIAYAGERSFSEDLSLSVRRASADEVVIEKSSGKVISAKKLNDSRLRSAIFSSAKMAIISEYGGFHLYNLDSGDDKILDDCSSGSAFDLSNDGQFFARSCDGFRTAIKITDLASGEVSSLDGHPSTIQAVAYSPDYTVLAVAGNDGNVYLFDPTTRVLTRTLLGNDQRIMALRFISDGSTLLTGDDRSTLRLWDLATGKILKDVKLNDRSDNVEAIETAADGSSFVVLLNQDAIILDRDLTPRGFLRTSEGYTETSGDMTLTSSSVPTLGAAVDKNASNVVTCHPDGTVRIWDIKSGRQIRKFKIAERMRFVAVRDSRSLVAIGDTGKHTNIKLVDSSTGKVLRQSNNIDGSYLEKVSISPDGRFAAVSDISGDITICDLQTMELKEVDNGLSGSDSIAFSRDSRTFFVGGEDQNLKLFATSTRAKLWQLLPDFVPDVQERNMDRARNRRIKVIVNKKRDREIEALAFIKANRRKIYVTFEHYGDMSDPGKKRMLESTGLKESKTKKSPDEANAVWLRLHNDSSLPVNVPTESMYLPDPKCFHKFLNGEKLYGLCNDREIGVRFGVKDHRGKWIPYGFDFGSSVTLLPNSTVVFPVPLSVWNKNYFIVFDFAFQNIRASENESEMDYGEKIELSINKKSISRLH